MNNFFKNTDLYYNNRSIEIVQLFPSFNLAKIKYSGTSEEITVDINFIDNQISKESYLTIKI
ncbi:hypothetical protein [Lysinibacillus halotolerans]|uniref:Uncharacterized protein n=1 Tax=Lysinibacillus halotolerans TaxID=1368476 RepID=A0A3M8H7R8_9BACI|nr:hypothetical protein [Lysinibacillus halotolerans]RNC98264.1 hypothetical protein EC501_11705 [Lysinibacillus halotolerans]